jgi:hypothetical protein
MRLFVLMFLVACGGDSGSEETLAPGANQASPDHVPVAGEGEISARLSGRVEVPDFTGGMIQMDAVAEVNGQSHVVANERYEEPGDFRLVVRGEHTSVDIFVYLIAGDSGPGAGDTRFEYPGNPVALGEGGDDVFELKDMVITVLPVEDKEGGAVGGPMDEVKGGLPGETGPIPPPNGIAGGDAGEMPPGVVEAEGTPDVNAAPDSPTTDE